MWEKVRIFAHHAWKLLWGPLALLLRIADGASVMIEWSGLGNAWEGVPESAKWIAGQAFQIGLPMAFGIWLTLRLKEWQLSRPDELPVIEVIHNAYRAMPKRARDRLEASYGEVHVAEEVGTMASQGHIALRGRTAIERRREPIAASYWVGARFDSTYLETGDNASFSTEPTDPHSHDPCFFDMTMSKGDARKIYERARHDPRFGDNDPFPDA